MKGKKIVLVGQSHGAVAECEVARWDWCSRPAELERKRKLCLLRFLNCDFGNRFGLGKIVEKKKAKILKSAFERYAKGNQRLEYISHFLAKLGIVTRSGKPISKTRVAFVLSNPFYVGLFKYGGELHEGKHDPIIAKKLFDEAQEVLKKRG